MTDSTPVLQLPYILPAQAQKHVTHNEAIRILDVIVQLSVLARNAVVPPENAAQGDRYILGQNAQGVWAGFGGQIALWENGAWQFFAPKTGWTAWVISEQVLASYSASGWISQADGPFNVGQLGISATPDATNRLSLSSPATLFNHAGAGHQLKINKAASSDTASLLFQTGFAGRAEMGTAGNDDFAIKVSADGSAFVTGLSIAAASGEVTLPAAARLGGQASDPAQPVDGMIWLNSATGEVKLRSGGATLTLASGALGVTDGAKGDVTVSAAGNQWVIADGAVGNAKLAPMPSGTFKARLATGDGAPQDITPDQAASVLPVFSAQAKGLAPASGGGAGQFLRADGVWAAPPDTGATTLQQLGVVADAPAVNRIANFPPPLSGWMVAGDPSWNLALGAGEVNNASVWPNTAQGGFGVKVATGFEDGLPFADYQLQVTPSGTYTWGFRTDGSMTPPCTEGQRFTMSYIGRRVGGTNDGHLGLSAGLDFLSSTGASLSGVDTSPLVIQHANSDTVFQISSSAPAGANRVRGRLWVRTNAGVPIDVTYRFKGVQLELGNARSTGRYAQIAPPDARRMLGFAANASLFSGGGFQPYGHGFLSAVWPTPGVCDLTFAAPMRHNNYQVFASLRQRNAQRVIWVSNITNAGFRIEIANPDGSLASTEFSVAVLST